MKNVALIFTRFLFAALVVMPCALRAANPVILQAPVTVAATFTFTGPETEKTSGASTTFQAKMVIVKFGNVELLSSMADNGEIPSIAGWSIVARWTAGDSKIDDYQLYAVKAGATPVALDATNNSVGITAETLAATYAEKWTNGVPVSGTGSFQSGVTMSLTDSGDTINLAGFAAGSYAIKALSTNTTPVYVPGLIKIMLLGGATLSGTEMVVNMSMTISAPKVVSN